MIIKRTTKSRKKEVQLETHPENRGEYVDTITDNCRVQMKTCLITHTSPPNGRSRNCRITRKRSGDSQLQLSRSQDFPRRRENRLGFRACGNEWTPDRGELAASVVVSRDAAHAGLFRPVSDGTSRALFSRGPWAPRGWCLLDASRCWSGWCVCGPVEAEVLENDDWYGWRWAHTTAHAV